MDYLKHYNDYEKIDEGFYKTVHSEDFRIVESLIYFMVSISSIISVAVIGTALWCLIGVFMGAFSGSSSFWVLFNERSMISDLYDYIIGRTTNKRRIQKLIDRMDDTIFYEHEDDIRRIHFRLVHDIKHRDYENISRNITLLKEIKNKLTEEIICVPSGEVIRTSKEYIKMLKELKYIRYDDFNRCYVIDDYGKKLILEYNIKLLKKNINYEKIQGT